MLHQTGRRSVLYGTTMPMSSGGPVAGRDCTEFCELELDPKTGVRLRAVYACIEERIGSFNSPSYLVQCDSADVRLLKRALYLLYYRGAVLDQWMKRVRSGDIVIMTFAQIDWLIEACASVPGVKCAQVFAAGGYVGSWTPNVAFASQRWREIVSEQQKVKPANGVVLPPVFFEDDFRFASTICNDRSKTALFMGRVNITKGADRVFELARRRTDWTFWVAGPADLSFRQAHASTTELQSSGAGAEANAEWRAEWRRCLPADMEIGIDLLPTAADADADADAKTCAAKTVSSVVWLREYPNVLYCGYANPARRRELMAQAAVLVQPTPYEEPFGMNVIEAALCGTPAIVTDSGAFRETIVHPHSGRRVPISDWAATVAAEGGAFDQVGGMDRTQCRQLATGYLADRLISRYIDFFDSLL